MKIIWCSWDWSNTQADLWFKAFFLGRDLVGPERALGNPGTTWRAWYPGHEIHWTWMWKMWKYVLDGKIGKYFLGLWQLYQHLWLGEPPLQRSTASAGHPHFKESTAPSGNPSLPKRRTWRNLTRQNGKNPWENPWENPWKKMINMMFPWFSGHPKVECSYSSDIFRFFVIRQPSRSNIHMFKNKKEVAKTTGHRPVNRSFWKKKRGFLQEKLKTLGFSRPSSHNWRPPSRWSALDLPWAGPIGSTTVGLVQKFYPDPSPQTDSQNQPKQKFAAPLQLKIRCITV